MKLRIVTYLGQNLYHYPLDPDRPCLEIFRPLVNTVPLLAVPAVPHASSVPHTQAHLFVHTFLLSELELEL